MKSLMLALGLGLTLAASAHAQTPPAKPAQPAAQSSQPGIRSMGIGAIARTFYTVAPADMLASQLINLDVYNLQNENLGEIEDLIIDNGKQIRAVVVSVGGFLGMGERFVAVKPGALMITPEADGTGVKVYVNTTREQLRGAPEFKFGDRMAKKVAS